MMNGKGLWVVFMGLREKFGFNVIRLGVLRVVVKILRLVVLGGVLFMLVMSRLSMWMRLLNLVCSGLVCVVF